MGGEIETRFFWNGNILLLSARHKFCIVYYRNIYINTRGGVYISQLIRYSRACVQYTDSLDRAQLRTQKLLKQGYVEIIATNTLRSLSRSGWLLRNIHISNDNGWFTFYVDLSLRYHCQYLYRTWLYIWVTRRLSNKKQDLLALREHMSCLVGSVLLICLVFCIVLLSVFTCWVQCCDVRCDFGIKTIFDSSLPPVVCGMAQVLFTFFVLVCVGWCVVFCFFLRTQLWAKRTWLILVNTLKSEAICLFS